jgi:hypothetical protein
MEQRTNSYTLKSVILFSPFAFACKLDVDFREERYTMKRMCRQRL